MSAEQPSHRLAPEAAARRIADEAEAIAAAREAAVAIAALAADPAGRKPVPHEQGAILARSGITAIAIPKALGGIGASIPTIVETVRIISAADGGIGQRVQIHNMMLRGIVRRPAGPLRDRIIRDVLDGERLGHAGAGAAHIFDSIYDTGTHDTGTSAQRDASGRWVVNGATFHTTGSCLAEWIVSVANSDEGPIGFVVNRDAAGVILDDARTPFGQRHAVSSGVRFVDLVLDDAQITPAGIDAPAKPERTALTWAQLLHAAVDAGIARGALDAAIHYLNNNAHVWIDADVERAVQEPLIIKRIGDYAIALRVAESLLRDAAELFDAYRDAGQPEALEGELVLSVAAARARTDHAALFISSDMFSLLGASASYRKFNLDRFWADARVHTTHDPIRWRLHHIGNHYLNGIPPQNIR